MKLPYKTGSVRVSSPYGWRTDPFTGVRTWHQGIDLVGSDKTIVAPCDGVIGNSLIITDPNNRTSEWGNYVRLDTDDGLKIYMCHMAQRRVFTGQRVKAGDIIGIEGSTGRSKGSHCHFEVRKNNAAVDPTPYLGIKNAVLTHQVNSVIVREDTYERNGLLFKKIDDFRIVYHDRNKRIANFGEYINGGFFAYYAENGINFTLPVANLVCDISTAVLSAPAKKYLSPFVFGDKLYYGCNNNQSNQFKNKAVSTLVVPKIGSPYIADLYAPPSDCKYAISGVPTVRNGDDVDYYNYVVKQGWDNSCMYATYRNWLGVRDGEIWVISGKTTAQNYIYGMQFWNWVKGEGFDDVICLDGGNSYYRKINGKAQATLGTRAVNNIITF